MTPFKKQSMFYDVRVSLQSFLILKKSQDDDDLVQRERDINTLTKVFESFVKFSWFILVIYYIDYLHFFL